MTERTKRPNKKDYHTDGKWNRLLYHIHLDEYIDYLEKELRKPRKRLQPGKWNPTAYN